MGFRVNATCRPYPQYGWDFPEEIPEKFRKDPRNALGAFPGSFPSRVRLRSPKPYDSRHLRPPGHFQNSLPFSTAGDASFSAEVVPERALPAVLRVFLSMRTQPKRGQKLGVPSKLMRDDKKMMETVAPLRKQKIGVTTFRFKKVKLEKNKNHFGRQFLGSLKPWRNKHEKFAGKLCHQNSPAMFLKFARPKKKITPKSALQSLRI